MTSLEMIHKLGLHPNHLGFNYIVRAIDIAQDYKEKDLLITKDIYPTIAREYGKKPATVGRAIERAIERLNPATLKPYFQKSCEGYKTPTAKQFITTIAKY